MDTINGHGGNSGGFRHGFLFRQFRAAAGGAGLRGCRHVAVWRQVVRAEVLVEDILCWHGEAGEVLQRGRDEGGGAADVELGLGRVRDQGGDVGGGVLAAGVLHRGLQ